MKTKNIPKNKFFKKKLLWRYFLKKNKNKTNKKKKKIVYLPNKIYTFLKKYVNIYFINIYLKIKILKGKNWFKEYSKLVQFFLKKKIHFQKNKINKLKLKEWK